MATIGGNIARPHSFNIFPAVLLGLDAKVKILSKAGLKTLPFAELYSAGFKLRPGRDCLILEIVIPAETAGWTCRFEKLAKAESSWEAYLALFMAVKTKGRLVKELRVSVGALGPKPLRAALAEAALTGKELSEAAAGTAAAELAKDMDAARASGYRKDAALALLKRFLEGVYRG
jgi:CO/xanthine dehydrogenase FAD-binding subunit